MRAVSTNNSIEAENARETGGFASLIISLVILPLMAGIFLDIKSCCDFTYSGETVITSGQGPCHHGELPETGKHCTHCCSSQMKVVFFKPSRTIVNNSAKLTLTFGYQFYYKTGDLPPPYKPPRT